MTRSFENFFYFSNDESYGNVSDPVVIQASLDSEQSPQEIRKYLFLDRYHRMREATFSNVSEGRFILSDISDGDVGPLLHTAINIVLSDLRYHSGIKPETIVTSHDNRMTKYVGNVVKAPDREIFLDQEIKNELDIQLKRRMTWQLLFKHSAELRDVQLHYNGQERPVPRFVFTTKVSVLQNRKLIGDFYRYFVVEVRVNEATTLEVRTMLLPDQKTINEDWAYFRNQWGMTVRAARLRIASSQLNPWEGGLPGQKS